MTVVSTSPAVIAPKSLPPTETPAVVFFRTSAPNQVFYMPDGTKLRFAGSLLATSNPAEIAELRAIAGLSTISEGTAAESADLKRELDAMADKNAAAAAQMQADDLAARVKAATGG